MPRPSDHPLHPSRIHPVSLGDPFLNKDQKCVIQEMADEHGCSPAELMARLLDDVSTEIIESKNHKI